MTPNFALSLSIAGITLLHRSTLGWDVVGEVPLDAPDLDHALRDLRDRALLIDPKGLRTKIIVPNDQIKYVTLPGGQTTQASVMAALDGATPYKVDDLAIDFERSGNQTQIAAVARETLEEAESFANEHDFGPVCFVAVAGPDSFVKEVFFGPTQSAKTAGGTMPDRDSAPVLQTGVARTPQEIAAAAVPVTETAAAKPAGTQTAAQTTGDATSEKIDTAPESEDVVFTAGTRASAFTGQTPAIKAPTVSGPVNATTRTAEAPRVKSLPGPTTEPLFTRRKEPPRVDVAGSQAPRIHISPPAATSLPTDPSAEAAQPPATPMLAAQPTGPNPVAVKLAAATAAGGAVAKSRKTKPMTDETPTVPRRKPRFTALLLTIGLLIFLFLVGLWANTLTEDGIAGWFNAGEDTAVVALDAPDDTAAPDVDTAMAPTKLPDEVVPDRTALEVTTPEDMPAPSALEPEETVLAEEPVVAPPLPIVRAPAGRVLSPAEADRIYAATGVYQRAPRMPLVPDVTVVEAFATPVVTPVTVSPEIAMLDDTQSVWTDLPLPPQALPPAQDVVFPRDLSGFILASPEGTITPYGAVVVAGSPSIVPPLRPGTEVVAPPAAQTIKPVATAVPVQEGVRLVAGSPPIVPPLRPAGLMPDQAQADAPSEPASDAPAITVTTPETDIAADATPANDVVLAVGRPTIAPPLRPAAFSTMSQPTDDVAAAITAGAVALTGFRPAVRPEDAAPAEIVSDPRLAGFRPSVRPDGIAPQEAIVEPVVDISAVAAAIANAAAPSKFAGRTARAISVSPRPDTRPRNFAQVVARSQALTRQQQQNNAARQASAAAVPTPKAATTTVAPTTVAPSGNVPGGVAQAATMKSAVRLRDMNLIGVYGKPNARRALVRMGNGRYVKVQVGSTLDGGRVTAIGDSALNFVKRGKTYALQLPRG